MRAKGRHKHRRAGARPSAPPAFHVMAKPAGPACNLACRYCFYLDKRALYPASRLRMSDAVLAEFTRQYMAAQRVPEVNFTWQGGEPTLLGLEFFGRAVAYQGRFARPGLIVRNALQTNATLLDDRWCEFLRTHGFLVGVSLDGPAPVHDAYRLDRRGGATFRRVMRGLRLLQKHGVEVNVLATVHAANVARPLEVYRFLRDEAAVRFIQFIPIVEPAQQPRSRAGSGPVSERSPGALEYGEFMCTVFDEWVRRDVGRVFVQAFDVALAAWVGAAPGLCAFSPTCGDALALEHNGDLYACDHFVTPTYRLGNIRTRSLAELVASRRQQRFGRAKADTLPGYCRSCEVRFACHGGCPKDRLIETPDGEPGLNYLCPGYRAFFGHIDRPMRTMAALLSERRPPAEIMDEASGRQRIEPPASPPSQRVPGSTVQSRSQARYGSEPPSTGTASTSGTS